MGYEYSRNDVYTFARSMSAETEEKGNELFFKYCPYCQGGGHDKETFSINLETGAFKCFRSSCGKQGHFVELARDFNFPLNFGISEKTYRKLPQKEIVIRDAAIEYLASRDISAETARRYKITTQTGKKNILTFPFLDENGIVVTAKYRKTDFDKNRDKNKEWFEKDTKPILFGMFQCKDFSKVIITEGQLDSLSVAECGFENAVSVPNGACGFTWISHCYDWVCKFEEIIIFGDCEKGKITLADEISKKFPSKVIKVVRMEDYLGEKDANDILRKYGKEAVRTCVKNAEIKPVKAVKPLRDVKHVDMNSIEKIKTGVYDIDRVIGGIGLGNVLLLTGKRGEGKSTFASQIVANAIDQGYTIFAYSGELPNYHFKNWIDLQIAGNEHIETSVNEYGDNTYWLTDDTVNCINAWYADKAYIFDNTADLDELSTETDNKKADKITLLGTMKEAVCRYGVKLVLLDNLMTALDVEPSVDLYRAQSEFAKKVKKIATQLDIAVVLIAHPKKEIPGKELDSDSVSGSSDVTNAVDYVLTYASNNGADKDTYQSLIGVTKNRGDGRKLFGDDRVKVRYSAKSKRIVCDNDDANKIYGAFKKQLPYTTAVPEEPPF